MISRSRKRIRPRRRVIKVSQHWDNIGDEYRLYPDGREVAFKTPKGDAWYRRQTLIMAERQNWVCGLAESGNCKLPGVRMSPSIGLPESASFDHFDKRGLGGSRKNDSVDPKFKNCASHTLCNGELGSRRIE